MNAKVYFLLFLAIFLLACRNRNYQESIVLEETNITETIEIDMPAIQGLNIVKFVNAPVGLNVRDSPDINSNRIGGLSDLAEVLVIREDGEIFTIDGIDGKWTYIEADGIQGWVFGGFLSLNFPFRSGVAMHNIDDIISFFYDHLNLIKLHSARNIEEFIEILGIGKNWNISHRIFDAPGLWGGTTLNEHIIEHGSYRLTIWNENLIRALAITLNESNFINLFPYRTIEEFLVSDTFGTIYAHQLIGWYGGFWGYDSIRFSPFQAGYSWTLIFKDSLLHAILYFFDPS